MRRVLTRLGWLTTGGMFALLLLGVGALVAQQPVVGVFSRIYLGGTGTPHCEIRWGSADPTSPGLVNTSDCALYFQVSGDIWENLTRGSTTWVRVANQKRIGTDFYATQFGAVCDGSTDDTAALQATVDAAVALAGRAGHVVLPNGNCATAGLVVGPITNPWQVSPAGNPLFKPNIVVQFTPPRAVHVGFTAGSSTITFNSGDITADDVGNAVYYGPFDATYTAVGASVITQPTYECTVTALLTTTSATCAATPYNWQVGPPLAPTTGGQTAFVTNDHDFELVSGGTLDPAHVGKSFTWTTPILRAPQDCYSALPCVDRAGPHTPPLEVYNTPAPCVGGSFADDWQCFNGGNIKLRYYSALVTSVTDPTHGKMQIIGLGSGTNVVAQTATVPTAGIQQGSFACNQFAPGVPSCGLLGQNPHLDDYVDFYALGAYLQATTGVGTLYPYTYPIDDSADFVSIRGASNAVTGLRWIGNTTGLPALTLSKNKYYRIDNLAVTNATPTPDQIISGALAGVGAGNVTNGTHSYRYACVFDRTVGNWAPVSNTVTVVNNAADGKVLLAVPVCGSNNHGDSPTARLIYRTKAAAAVLGPWYELATVPGNVTTAYTDNIADGSIVTAGFAKGNSIGVYLGGLPGPGAQAIDFRITKLAVAGFHIGTLLGDNLGGEASDGTFNQLGGSDNDICLNTAAGSFNTLDIYFNQLNCVLNRVGVKLAGGGSFHFTNGGASFNGVDFWGAGSFGPVSIKGFRSEGMGRFWYGDIPQLTIEDTLFAEPSGAREIVGNVTATPDNTHTESITVTSTTCPQNLCPITFAVGDITGRDAQHVVVVPGFGPAGTDVVGTINSVSTTTDGLILVLGNHAMSSTGAVTATLYDTNTVDLTWPSGQVVVNDVGAAFRMPQAEVTGAWNSDVRVYITSFLSATTGKGAFILNGSASGGGPVQPAGGTTTNPTLFDNTTIEITSGNYQTFLRQLHGPNGMIKVNPCNIGSLTIDQSTLFSPSPNPFPMTLVQAGSQFVIDPDSALPNSTTIVQSGVLYSGSVRAVNCQSAGTNFKLRATNNLSSYFAGPTRFLSDGVGTVARNVLDPLVTMPQPTAGTLTGDFYEQNYPTDPVLPLQQFNHVKELSEAPFANGHNLRILCTFATSDTVVCPFERNETYTYNSNGTGGTTHDATTSTFRVLVDSNHFTQADVGKIIKFPLCCGDFATIAGGARNLWAAILTIVDATHVDTRVAFGNISGFPTGASTGSATVGQAEPDANWIPALWGCTGVDLSGPEVIRIESHDASGVTLKSSNATSTASCLVGVIR